MVAIKFQRTVFYQLTTPQEGTILLASFWETLASERSFQVVNGVECSSISLTSIHGPLFQPNDPEAQLLKWKLHDALCLQQRQVRNEVLAIYSHVEHRGGINIPDFCVDVQSSTVHLFLWTSKFGRCKVRSGMVHFRHLRLRVRVGNPKLQAVTRWRRESTTCQLSPTSI